MTSMLSEALTMDGQTLVLLTINVVALYVEILKGDKDKSAWIWASGVALATVAWSIWVNAYALVMLGGCRVIIAYRNHKRWSRDTEGRLSLRIEELESQLSAEKDMAFDLMRRVNDSTDDRHERRSILTAYEMRCRDNEVPCDDLATRAKELDAKR